MEQVCLVACVAKKHAGPCMAKELYCSPWFRLARRYAESTYRSWFILSAKYGLLTPEEIIKSYDETLNRMPVLERKSWAARVVEKTSPHKNYVILAGRKYREFLLPNMKHYTIPMKGMGIGQQMSWLISHTETANDSEGARQYNLQYR